MKTTLKRVLSLLLALVLMLSLCACTQKSQEDSDEPDNTGGFALPTKNDREKTGKRPTKHTGTAEGRNSLMWLRDRIDVPMTMFGAAYLGYADDLFEEEFEEELPAWLWENNEAMLREYPFIAEIDENHIIGGTGYLYCIVPVDENASVAINRVKWDNKTRSEKVTEVLYRSENGEPVLLFANQDGVAYEADTQVIITDSSGNICEWYPSLDADSYLAPCITDEGEYLLWDFTEYAWQSASPDLALWLADGWTGMTALGLAGSQSTGTGWFIETTREFVESSAYFSLRFYLDDETGGSVDLDWAYEDSDDFEEMWSGFWTIEPVLDGPSYVTISLSLVGGKNYALMDGPSYMSETYPCLISPSGDELLIGRGENGIALPFMSWDTTTCMLTQAVG